ncbi:HAMP domain-containing histidine kinase [Roseomonas sp. SSH11]|uniref:histidine kinase n=1 Tax=Pararoseomonas baculiformis TaxID=2820812 RepID=A0ABS4AIH3_9PROT|nr:HAMP domain-containing sensor histidine kinase [Pararoseomonas baculiformis]MBP0446793.1 HAMP domain-containing histidine kinase [Pararoseomonas baculiformis]
MPAVAPGRQSPSLIRQLALIHAGIGLVALFIGAFVLHQTLSRVVWLQHQRAILAAGAEVIQRLGREGPPGLARPFSPETARRFDSATGSMRYALLASDGRLIATSSGAEPGLPRLKEGTPLASFQTGQDGSLLWGVTQDVQTPQGRLWLQIAQDMSRSYVVLDEVPIAALGPTILVLAVGALLLFGANAGLLLLMLRPLRRAAQQAGAIGQGGAARLELDSMPVEVRPLITAVNGGLDRLDDALAWQRGFSEEVAHELRTPLAIIQAELDLLDPGPARDRLRRDVEELSRLVGDLLEAAEAASDVPVGNDSFDLAALVAEAVPRLASLAREGRSVIGPGRDGPLPVRGDRDSIGRVLRNLVENALAISPPGTAVEIGLDERRPAAEAVLAVSDRGPGVPIAERSLVFRRRWRAGDTHRRGLGLGLSIVERIARAHGGRVQVGDNPGGGAVFTVTLPLAPETAAANAAPE